MSELYRGIRVKARCPEIQPPALNSTTPLCRDVKRNIVTLFFYFFSVLPTRTYRPKMPKSAKTRKAKAADFTVIRIVWTRHDHSLIRPTESEAQAREGQVSTHERRRHLLQSTLYALNILSSCSRFSFLIQLSF